MNNLCRFTLGVAFLAVFALGMHAQTHTQAKSPRDTMRYVPVKLPEVTVIDDAGLKKAIQPNGKPLLINFWATWCDPCREEFPDLVKINADYKNKIDFITISLDDLAEIKRDVPKFLSEMKADMPAYLLKVPDESEAISSVSKDWTGGLPFTILFGADGKMIYLRQGKVSITTLRTNLDHVLTPAGN